MKALKMSGLLETAVLLPTDIRVNFVRSGKNSKATVALLIDTNTEQTLSRGLSTRKPKDSECGTVGEAYALARAYRDLSDKLYVLADALDWANSVEDSDCVGA